MRHILSLFIFALFSVAVSAQTLRLPRFFADGMVMQRDSKLPVWGWGEPGQTIKVNLNGKNVFGKVNANGEWKVYLPKMKAGGPYNMSVDYVRHGQATKIATLELTPTVITVQNILIGDVFLCSGQSNMELPIRRCMDVVADDVKDYSNTQIRYLKFPHQYNYVQPNNDVRTNGWQDINPKNCGEVSGICYFMARYLQAEKNVPIGIINSAVGGTQVQSWMPRATLIDFEGYADELAKQKYHQQNWPDSIMRLENKAFADWQDTMMRQDTILNRWRTPGYDFSSWHKVNLFADWSKGKNGAYWFRKVFTLDKRQEGKDAILRLGAMKDADSVFVNGTFVGNTTYEYPPRIYKVPAGILREGTNDIVVHLMSQSGRANFTSGKLYQLEIGDDIIRLADSSGKTSLNDDWTYAVGTEMPRRPSSTYFVDCPTGLYNAMIAPLRDFPVKAAMWYQGESNVGNTSSYGAMLQAMIGAWRKQFGSNFPVAIVQLAGYMSRHDKPFESGWTQIRNQQYRAALSTPNTALVSIFDTGEWNDIHPQDKRTAGYRASLVMRRLAYGEKSLVAEGPTPVSAKRVGDSIVVTFSKATGKLRPVSDPAIRVTGDYELTIPASISTVTFNIKDNRLRYAWDDYPITVLYNEQGIPSPQWEVSLQ